MPDAEDLSRADGRALCAAWVIGPSRPKPFAELVPWLRAELLAADTLDRGGAIDCVEYWIRWFEERATIAIDGTVSTLAAADAVIEKFYFDGPESDDWPALASRRGSFVPAFGPNHVFVPASD